MANSNPAELLKINHSKGYILPGFQADLTIFDDELEIQMTFVDGQLKYNKFKNTIRDPDL